MNVISFVRRALQGAKGGATPVADDNPLPVYLATPNAFAGATPGQYEMVAASQTTQALGATGAAGDYLAGLLIVPATTGAGTVAIKDGSNTAINVFVTGTLADLRPIWVPLGLYSVQGAWQITTGTNVSAIAVGRFT
jgi:hypothetical protein